MNNILAAVSHHAYVLLFLVVFAESAGLPAPAALALIAAGAAAAAHILSLPAVLATAIVAMMIGDTLLFLIGRYTGWALLSFICSLSLNPETCILRSAESFYKRGRLTLLFAKFIPGINTMAPPLAGSMKMRVAQFLRLDLAGSFLYALAYAGVGYLFRDLVAKITRGVQNASRVFAEVVIAATILYLVYRIVQYHRYRMTGVVPRVDVAELAERLASQEQKDI